VPRPLAVPQPCSAAWVHHRSRRVDTAQAATATFGCRSGASHSSPSLRCSLELGPYRSALRGRPALAKQLLDLSGGRGGGGGSLPTVWCSLSPFHPGSAGQRSLGGGEGRGHHLPAQLRGPRGRCGFAHVCFSGTQAPLTTRQCFLPRHVVGINSE